MKRNITLLVALVLGILPALASAQPANAPAADAVPAGVTTDWFSFRRMAAGMDIGLIRIGNDSDVSILHMDIHGQVLSDVASNRMGGYIELPINYLRGDNESLSALGNLELGALLLPRYLDIPLLLRAGLSFDTAPGSDEPAGSIALLSSLGRLTDLYTQIPGSSWMRLSASSFYRNGRFTARADIGLDIPLSMLPDLQVDPIIRVNVAVGVDLDSLLLMAEVAALGATGATDRPARLLQSLGFSVQGVGRIAPIGGIVFLADRTLRDSISLAVTAGLRASL